jgi:AcrR family transcriptional regulator
MADEMAHVRRLWRHRGAAVRAARRGPRPQLDLDEIVSVAIAIADAGGLAAVSTRAVAARFDKTAMALYAYVGTKEHLLALMQDQACAMPDWVDPAGGLTEALRAWAMALFEVYVEHPWLTQLSWAQAAQGPHERDWLERLLSIMDRWGVAAAVRSPVVTTLYATVRACAETDAAYRRLDRSGEVAWRERAQATRALIPDIGRRYPLSTALEPVSSDWRDQPRAGLAASVALLAPAIGP